MLTLRLDCVLNHGKSKMESSKHQRHIGRVKKGWNQAMVCIIRKAMNSECQEQQMPTIAHGVALKLVFSQSFILAWVSLQKMETEIKAHMWVIYLQKCIKKQLGPKRMQRRPKRKKQYKQHCRYIFKGENMKGAFIDQIPAPMAWGLSIDNSSHLQIDTGTIT